MQYYLQGKKSLENGEFGTFPKAPQTKQALTIRHWSESSALHTTSSQPSRCPSPPPHNPAIVSPGSQQPQPLSWALIGWKLPLSDSPWLEESVPIRGQSLDTNKSSKSFHCPSYSAEHPVSKKRGVREGGEWEGKKDMLGWMRVVNALSADSWLSGWFSHWDTMGPLMLLLSSVVSVVRL